MACITLFSVVYLNPTTTSIRNWCIICFFITELKYLKYDFCKIKKNIVAKTLFIVLLSNFICFLTSPHIFGSISGIKDFLQKIISCDLLIVYSYLSFRTRKQLRFFYRILFYCLILLTFFAILNFITHSSNFVNYAINGNISNASQMLEQYGDKYIESERFRVQAMFANPFDYGYVCVVYMCVELYAYFRKIQERKYSYIAFACCLFGIFTCGCRTVITCFFIAIFSFSAFISSRNVKRIAYLSSSLLVLVLLYNTIPFLHDKMDLMFSVLSDQSGEKVGGSSVYLRQQQINAVMSYVKDSLLFGRGGGFFSIDLDFSKGISNMKDGRLMGLEGIYMEYLLERGLVGLFLWILYYILLLFYFYKKRFKDKYGSAVGITIIIVYVSFACMTGQLLSLYPTLLLLGLLLKILDSKKKKNRAFLKK